MLQEQGEESALTTGLALKSERVIRLKVLAQALEEDIFGDRLWVSDVKGVGSGDAAEVVKFEYFNKAEVESYRGVLDDLAAEMGERSKSLAVTGAGGGPVQVTVVYQEKLQKEQGNADQL